MDSALLLGVGVVLLAIMVVGLAIFALVQDHKAVTAESRGRREGLQMGSDAVQRVVQDQLHQVDGQVETTKQRDPVDVANELIAGAKKS